MKFEVLYANGVQHEVELQAYSVVVGRDPSCDLVLNDAKCSRRHAVLEMGPSGLSIRDNGSANGVFVNGKKVERASVIPGDILRVGETVLKVLPEAGGTVVMGEDELDEFRETEDLARPEDLGAYAEPPPLPDLVPEPPPPAAPYAPPPPPPAPPRSHSLPPRPVRPPTPAPVPMGPPERPLTVTVLAALWLLAGAVYGAVGLGVAIFGSGGSSALGAGAFGILMMAISIAVGYGLWARAAWGRLLQMLLAGVGVIVCPFTLPSIAIIAYLLRPEIRLHFGGARALSPDEAQRARTATPEMAFTLGIVGTMVFGLLLTAVGAYFTQNWMRARTEVPPGRAAPANEPAASPAAPR